MKKMVLPAIICIILALILKNVISSTVTLVTNGNVLDKLETELEAKKQEKARLAQELYEVKTNNYVEEQARTNLGLLKEGEYVVLDAHNKEKIQGKEAPPPVPNYQKWWDVFF